MTDLLTINNLVKHFPAEKKLFGKQDYVHAVNNVSLEVREGETFSVVGESGCGKSTVSRLINHLIQPDSGEIWFDGTETAHLSENEFRPFRQHMQMIFQDPNSSLDPNMRIFDLISEPLLIFTEMSDRERRERVRELLEVVGLSYNHAERYPHEFSGGQRQRIGIARALSVNPKLIIADEPISSLDVSIQAQILNLLQKLQKQFNLTYFFISHDLSVVQLISDHVAVMYLGFIVEKAPKKELYQHPLHPYTQALLSAVPIPDPKIKKQRILLAGDLPSNIHLPAGCSFNSRCFRCQDRCREEKPELREIEKDHFVACHFAEL